MSTPNSSSSTNTSESCSVCNVLLRPDVDRLDLTWTEKLAYMTWQFLQLPQSETPVEHEWRDGRYYRTMRIPKDTLFIGRAHRMGHEVQLLEGAVELIFPAGKEYREAPDAMRTVPGFHTVFRALTDVVGRTVHPDTGERDIETLEHQIFESTESLVKLGESIHQRLTCQA
jgi:hypothetical protein